MIGPLLIVIGLLGIWAVTRDKAKPVLDAIMQANFSTSLDNSLGQIKLGPSPTTGGGTSSGTGAQSGGSSADIGTHQGLVDGVVVTIDKTYAQMTDTEKKAANDFAHAQGG